MFNFHNHSNACFPPCLWSYYSSLTLGLDERTNNVAEFQNALIKKDIGIGHKELDLIADKLQFVMEFWNREWERALL